MSNNFQQVHQALARQTARQREQQQALARSSRVRMFVRTTGVGETKLDVQFGALLLEEPTLSFGVHLDEPPTNGTLPIATPTVMSFIQNKKGLYTGAHMGFRVESAKFDIKLKFSLTFEASALRTVLPGGLPASDSQANR